MTPPKVIKNPKLLAKFDCLLVKGWNGVLFDNSIPNLYVRMECKNGKVKSMALSKTPFHR